MAVFPVSDESGGTEIQRSDESLHRIRGDEAERGRILAVRPIGDDHRTGPPALSEERGGSKVGKGSRGAISDLGNARSSVRRSRSGEGEGGDALAGDRDGV